MGERDVDGVLAAPPDLAGPGDLPAHVRIASWLEELIASGRLHVGDRLPSEIPLAEHLGVSRMTLRQALAGLEGRGLLERRRGRLGGTFVAEPRFDVTLSGLPGLTEQMRRAHVEAGAEVVRARTAAPPADVRAALRLRRGDRAHEVVRVRSGNGTPLALEDTWLPAAVFAGFLDHDVTGSLYALMHAEYDRGPHSADELVEPVKATAEQAALLGVEPDAVLLLLTRTAYAADGTPVEFSRDRFRPDRTRLVLHSHVDHGTVAEATRRSR